MTTTAYDAEKEALDARYLAALNFIQGLTTQPMNPKLVAADYALQGSFMRSYDVEATDFRDGFANIAEAIRDAAS
jgi:hypothetical protein